MTWTGTSTRADPLVVHLCAFALLVVACAQRTNRDDGAAPPAVEPSPPSTVSSSGQTSTPASAHGEEQGSLSPAESPVADPIRRSGPAGDEPVYNVGGDVVPPKSIFRPSPDYASLPSEALRFGAPILRAVISKTGEVTEVEVFKSAAPEIDRLFVETVRRWRFEPATKDGVPVAVQYYLTTTLHPR